MEFTQENRSFCTPAAVLDTVAEQLADVDITLPDYCPDIEKILKCTLIPKIQSRSFSGGQLQVEGYCIVSVMYVEQVKKSIRCCEQSVNFSQSFTVREGSDNPVIITKTKSEYINCRALSPRRLVMHGAFSLYVKVFVRCATEIFSDYDSELETLKKAIRRADLKSFCQDSFTVTEELSAADKPAIESVLRSDISVNVIDTKAVTGKLMLNGEINLRMLYLADVESGETAKLDYLVPFNRIIDCEGIDENTLNCVECTVLSYDIHLKNDMLSEKPAIVFDVRLCVTEEGYIIGDEEIITDAYSVRFSSKPEIEQLKYCEEIIPVREMFMEKNSIKIGSGKISKIIDIYSDHIGVEIGFENSVPVVNGKLNLCMIALNEENVPVFIERSFDYKRTLASAEGCTALSNAETVPASISYRLTDDSTVEIRCELRFTASASKLKSITAVRGTEVFEDKPLENDGCALTLYFASKGERLWDIAKSHNTRLEMILSENSENSEVLENDGMLLIPRI